MKSITEWCRDVYDLGTARGWWETRTGFPEAATRIHAEISAAFEQGERWGESNVGLGRFGEPEGLLFELADTVIRIMDYCEHTGLDLEAAIAKKYAHIKTSPYVYGMRY